MSKAHLLERIQKCGITPMSERGHGSVTIVLLGRMFTSEEAPVTVRLLKGVSVSPTVNDKAFVEVSS